MKRGLTVRRNIPGVQMFRIVILFVVAALSACTWGGGGNGNNFDCSVKGQKQFVLSTMRHWYFWNDALPKKVNIGDYETPQDLLAFLTTFSPDDGTGNPIDIYSYIDSAAADAQYFAAGQYLGFGFNYKLVAADDARLQRVFTDSPAALAGLARGQRILELNGRSIADIQAAEGIDAVFQTTPVEFHMQNTDASEFTVSIDQDVVTIDPVPQSRIIDAGGGRMVGYVELAAFIGTADARLDDVFAEFAANGVTDVILDLRYNGGGLVSTAELLADFLGGLVAENQIFSKTLFNADRAKKNNRETLFDRLGNSIGLSRLVVLATSNTASASELLTNGMEPHVEVTIVGGWTFGKPVGQIGAEFCGNVLRPTTFQTVNADDFGDFFDGLPPDCPVGDDLGIAVGADNDPNLVMALGYLASGACPIAAPGSQMKPEPVVPTRNKPHGPPWKEYSDAR
jgi:carboxyl-terminal processing protease